MLGSSIKLFVLYQQSFGDSNVTALAQRLVEEKAIALANSWQEEKEPLDKINAQNILISCSAIFISKYGDGINLEKALELGRKLQV